MFVPLSKLLKLSGIIETIVCFYIVFSRAFVVITHEFVYFSLLFQIVNTVNNFPIIEM